MDRIIVLENGVVVEDGKHEELLKQKGRYAKLWEMQSSAGSSGNNPPASKGFLPEELEDTF